MNDPNPDMETLMQTHAPPLLRYATRLLRNPHSAQDVVQQVFIRFARLNPDARPPSERLRAWLYRCTHNQAVDLIRAEQRRKTLHESHAETLVPATSDPRLPAVLEKVHLLPDSEKSVLLLRLQEGLSYREIAEVTGLKEGNIGWLLHQAVKTLSTQFRNAEALS